jgi:hypothetical protein
MVDSGVGSTRREKYERVVRSQVPQLVGSDVGYESVVRYVKILGFEIRIYTGYEYEVI